MSFATQRRDRPAPGLAMAPMVDLLFLLLIFFLTSSVFREEEGQIDVSLPSTRQAAAAASPTQITITVAGDGTISLGSTTHTLESLQATLTQLARDSADEPVVIRGDQQSNLGLIVKILDAAYAANLRSVYLATVKPASEVGRGLPNGD